MTQTLADLIIDRARVYKDWPFVPAAAAALAGAQRFVVSDDVIEAATHVVMTRPTTLVEALAFARPPFEKSWFEWDLHTAGHKSENLAHITPLRVGALLTRLGPHVWTMLTAWSYSVAEAIENTRKAYGEKVAEQVRQTDPGIGVSGLLLGVDFTPPISAPSEIIVEPDWYCPRPVFNEKELASRRDAYTPPIRYALADKREREALEAINQRLGYQIRDHQLIKMATDQNCKEEMFSAVLEEAAPIMSMLILLNSKNCTSVKTVDPPSKLNKARIKRGQVPLPSYSVVHINLSRTQSNVTHARGMSDAEIQRHKVRGHFKTRKTGVYYWRDFERGSATKGKVDHTYEVAMT